MGFSISKLQRALIYLDIIAVNQKAVSRNYTAWFKDYDITNNDLVHTDGLRDTLLSADDSDFTFLLPVLKLDELLVLHIVIDGAEPDQNYEADHDREALHPPEETILTDETSNHGYESGSYQ